MKIKFIYDKEKDIECLLDFGKSSHNSPFPTKEYEELVSKFGENPDKKSTSLFIEEYIKKNNYNIPEYVSKHQKDFDEISEEFQKIAEKVFGVSLKDDVTAYLTINGRLPYNIKNNYFFVHVREKTQRHLAMHELWHFYTWHKYGKSWVEKMGFQKYNDIKESLTVLLNVLCKDLFPEGVKDIGYPQHQELRTKILELWEEKSDIEYVWDNIIKD